ncbi:sirohydrochlorin cobaltochelatase [Sedimentibacter sp. MB31-C6]|uniref:sirohydrochlorin cobaltochelatase n=1 Tax=Sedimentibacter sp. MB31-C6 TaxID=3109366 RepID=UPI002DDD963D|nr:sirohydrochlorin cobaltochelatase [Sedimentibacter sp. MB36-C1]WSI05053.1 sirohydrochlorin cobaltochelatase [Sedimentibacter sp. MB36-C1]
MKKIIVLITTVLAVLSLGGCTPNENVESKNTVNVGDPEKKAILVVSFGTSYNDTRKKTIDAIETAISDAYDDYEIRRAFTSQFIIDKLKERDELYINNVDEAMKDLVADNIGTLVVQPTHVMNGFEYEEMMTEIKPYIENFDSIAFSDPLITSMEDYIAIVEAYKTEIATDVPQDTALVLMGHGTHHYANSTYAALDYIFKDKGMSNVFVGTVESYPDVDTVIAHVKEAGYTKVIIEPLMIVAGDHANNDMAGDEEDSWKTIFQSEGFEVDCVLKGLGEYESIHKIYVDHVGNAIKNHTE